MMVLDPTAAEINFILGSLVTLMRTCGPGFVGAHGYVTAPRLVAAPLRSKFKVDEAKGRSRGGCVAMKGNSL